MFDFSFFFSEAQKNVSGSKDGLDVKNLSDKTSKEENGLATTRQYTYTKDVCK